MDRTSFLLELATQRKFAYKSEDLSVTNTSSTSTSSCSDKSSPPSPEKKHIYKADSRELPLKKKIFIHSNVSIPATSQVTSTFGSELVSDEKMNLQDGVKLPEFSTINSKIVSKCINNDESSFFLNSFDNEMIRNISSVPVSVTENAMFQGNSQKLSDAPKSFQLELDLENVSEMSLIPIKTNTQDDECKNLEYTILKNADVIKKSNTFFKGNDNLEHLVSAFDESDLMGGETSFDAFEDFTSSGSEYVPSDYSSSSTSDIDESEIFDVMKVEKTYSKRNQTEQLFGASAGEVAKEKVTHILSLILT